MFNNFYRCPICFSKTLGSPCFCYMNNDKYEVHYKVEGGIFDPKIGRFRMETIMDTVLTKYEKTFKALAEHEKAELGRELKYQ